MVTKDQALADLDSIVDAYYGGDSTLVPLAHERLRRNIQQSPPVPEGWTVVPVEPTEEMRKAATNAVGPYLSYTCWEAMLAAAPDPRANHWEN